MLPDTTGTIVMDLSQEVTIPPKIGGLSKAEVEDIITASIEAGVPQDGTPAYFE